MEYEIIENIPLSGDTYSMTINAPDIAQKCYPGQFVNVRVPYDRSKILRRPISICFAKEDTITIAFQVKGEGTGLLSELYPGDKVDMLGPLGRGFPLFQNKKAALVGGGIGVFPLLYLKTALEKNCEVDSYLGFRNEECVVMTDEFGKGQSSLCVSTDDGSVYNKGYITSYFEEKARMYDVVYCCGPVLMMEKVQRTCLGLDIPLYLSLEQRMGCGIGACLVCACKIKAKNEKGYDYLHVCKDGPVFDAREVIL